MKNILIVDDEQIRHETIIKHCGNGCQFFFAKNYNEAVAALTQERIKFNAIFLDHDMGVGLTGNDLAKWITECCMFKEANLSFDVNTVRFFIHTANSYGAKNMFLYLKNIVDKKRIIVSSADSFFFEEHISDFIKLVDESPNIEISTTSTSLSVNEEAALCNAIIKMMGHALLKENELAITEIENVLPNLKRVELQFVAHSLLVSLHDLFNKPATTNLHLTKCFEIFKTKEFKAILMVPDPPFQSFELADLFIDRLELLSEKFLSKNWISIEQMQDMFKDDPSLN